MTAYIIKVRNRRIITKTPTLVQGCAWTDSITLDLDEEWHGMKTRIILGNPGCQVMADYDGTPIPISVDFPPGYIGAKIEGVSDDGRRIATMYNPNAFKVVR